MSPHIADTELILPVDDLRLRALSYGTSLRRMWREERDENYW